jgi:hypothetical protein
MSSTGRRDSKVYIEVHGHANRRSGVKQTGRLADTVIAKATLIELPEEVYPKLALTAGRITEAIRRGLSDSVHKSTEVTLRFGLTITTELDVQIVSASTEAAIEIELSWKVSRDVDTND